MVQHLYRETTKTTRMSTLISYLMLSVITNDSDRDRDALLVSVCLAETRTLLSFMLILMTSHDSIMGRLSLASVEICLCDRSRNH